MCPPVGPAFWVKFSAYREKSCSETATNVMPSAGMCSGCVVLLRFPARLRAGGRGKGRALHRSVATVGKERPK